MKVNLGFIATSQRCYHLEQSGNNARTPDKMGSAIKDCNNVPVKHIQSGRVHKHQHGKWCRLKSNLLGVRGKDHSGKDIKTQRSIPVHQELTSAKRAEIKMAVSREVIKFNFSEKCADKSFQSQALQSMYGAIFGRSKDAFISYCKENQIPSTGYEATKCFITLGDIAKDYKMDCTEIKTQEKNMVQTSEFTNHVAELPVSYLSPVCIGANPFTTLIMTSVSSEFKTEFSDNNVRKEFSQYAEEVIADKLRDIALLDGMPDPKNFAKALSDAMVEYMPDY